MNNQIIQYTTGNKYFLCNVSHSPKAGPLRAPASPARTSDIIIVQLVSFPVSVGIAWPCYARVAGAEPSAYCVGESCATGGASGE